MEIDRVLTLVDLVDRNGLREVCVFFRGLFSLSVRVFGADGSLLAEDSQEEPLCQYLHGFPEARRRCSEYRGQIKRFVPTGVEPSQTRCFSGCAYEVVPIVHDGEVMGKVVFGPFLPAETEHLPQELLRLDPRIDGEALGQAAAPLCRPRRDTIDRIVSAFRGILGLILHSGHRAALVSETHLLAMGESHRVLEERNKALEEAVVRLQSLDRLKSNFLAAVSHELRTPLTSIIGYSEMLTQEMAGPLNEEQKRFAQTILEKGEHLLQLISSVIDVSALDAGSLKLHREPTDVAALCGRATEKVLAQAGRKDVRVVPQVEGTLPPVPVDPALLEKALVQVIDNAVKFSPPSGTVTIDFRLVEPRSDGRSSFGFVVMAPTQKRLEIAVSDRGPGIPEDERDRVFEAFYQMDGSATRTHGGLGLGLALVRQFVEAHGGKVEIDSQVGHGSTFRLLLPLPADAA